MNASASLRGQDVWIGLDIGGTKIAAGVVVFPPRENVREHILVLEQRVPTHPTRGGVAVLEECLALTQRLMQWIEAQGAHFLGIGIGVAEVVDLSGRISSQATIAWQGWDFAQKFAHLAPTLVEADVRAAAFAEAQFGAGRAYPTFGYFTVGTGISACLVQTGVPYAGARGNALLLGSSILQIPCDGCDTPTNFILEEFASGSALVARYNRVASTPLATGEAIIEAQKAGDLQAQRVVETAADALGMGIALYVNVLDPAAIIVGGGLGSAGGMYWERATAAARRLIWAENARDLPIQHAALGPAAGMIGAAALAQRRFSSIP